MIEKLKLIDRFAELPTALLQELGSLGRIISVKKGETLFFEGDDCSSLYVVVSGSVKIAKTLESGKELIVDILGQGEAVGEVALLDDFPFPATAAAHADSEVFVLAAGEYFRLLDTHPELGRAIIRDLASRLRNISRRLKDVSGGNVEYRIAHVLLTLGDRIGTHEENRTQIDMPLSRQEMADMVGTTIETAIRILSRWNKEGLVETTKRGFILHDLDRLREIGESSL